MIDTIPTASPRYIDAAEAAKMMRPLLRAAFPGVKFTVRTSKYAGGASVDVGWTDGPRAQDVDRVLHGFAGKRFEGMTDCAYVAQSWWCPEHAAAVAQTYGCDVDSNNRIGASRCCANAELVQFHSDYVHTTRRMSAEMTAALAARVRRECGMPETGSMDDRLPEGSRWQYGCYDTVRNGVYRLGRETAA